MTFSAPVTGTIIVFSWTIFSVGFFFFAMDLSLKNKKDNQCFSVIEKLHV